MVRAPNTSKRVERQCPLSVLYGFKARATVRSTLKAQTISQKWLTWPARSENESHRVRYQ